MTATELNNLCWTKGTAGVMLEFGTPGLPQISQAHPEFRRVSRQLGDGTAEARTPRRSARRL